MQGTLQGLAAAHEVEVVVLSQRLGTIEDAPAAGGLEWLRSRGAHPSDRWFSERVLAELLDQVRATGARLVVLESVWLHRYIEPLKDSGCQVVLDAHGIETALQAELASTYSTSLVRIFAERTRALERQAFATADLVWVPSARDAELARSLHGDELALAVVPNGIELERYAARGRGEGPFTVMFSASFDYPPNVRAAGRLLSGIFPLLRKLVPDARLSLVGREPSEQMRAAAGANCDGIEVTGEVEQIAPYLAAANVMAVPLSEGHGTRFKVLEAFASELPVLATRKAVEGLDVAEGRDYLAAETDAEFAKMLARLATEPRAGAATAAHALELVRDRHSLASVTDAINAALGVPA